MNLHVLISVYNISGYLMAEAAELLRRGVQVGIIETPCSFSPKMHEMYPQIRWFTSVDGCDFEPDIFLCGGWVNKSAVKFAKRLHENGVATVLLIDTPWQGKLRQYIHCLYSRFYLTRIFDFAWGAGKPQAMYLRRLGFSDGRIKLGYYAADTNKFASLYQPNRCVVPHTFLYVGRYVEVKNMRFMEKAFIKAIELMPQSDWNLVCIGKGVLWDERIQHPRIIHLGYKPPHEIQNHVSNAGVFVLPSIFEPWGVVVHEFALMGLPLLCSEQVQATTAYLKEGENGYLFNPTDEASLVSCFMKIMSSSDQTLCEMGRKSHELGLSYKVSDWADVVMKFKTEA